MPLLVVSSDASFMGGNEFVLDSPSLSAGTGLGKVGSIILSSVRRVDWGGCVGGIVVGDGCGVCG